MRALHAALPRRQRGDWVETAAELAPRARSLVDAGDIVLVKGSKGIEGQSWSLTPCANWGRPRPPGRRDRVNAVLADRVFRRRRFLQPLPLHHLPRGRRPSSPR